MKIKSIGKNQTEVVLSNGDIILLSYDTPIAIIKPIEGNVRNYGKRVYNYCKQGTTITTEKHIDKFFIRHNGIRDGDVSIYELETLIDNDNPAGFNKS